MDKQQLQVRAEKRRKLAQVDPQDSLVAEIGTIWLQQARERWNPQVNPRVPDGIPVGPAFIQWVKKWMKDNRFRTLEFGDGAIKAGAEAVANWVDYNGSRVVGVDYPNPLTEINKAKGEGYTIGSTNKQTKTADTVYGPLPERHHTTYVAPEEWTRYCPEHAGVMLRRVSDGIYQCPIEGGTFTYTGGHEVEHKIGVQNQTTGNWNTTFPQKTFLDTPNQQTTRASGGTYDEDSKKKLPSYKKNEDTNFKSAVELHAEASLTKKAEEGYFGKTTLNSRYCPDHPGTSLYRIADYVYQCPLDRSVYNYAEGFTTQDGVEHNGGSISEMTPDRPDFYQSPHPFLSKSSVKGFMKTALQPVKLSPTPEYEKKSALERFMEQTKSWGQDKPLEDAQKETINFLESTKINPKTKAQMIAKTQSQSTVERLIAYLWQSLLAGSGMRTSSLEKKAYNLEYRFARDLDLALRGEENSKKIIGLVVDGVFKGKPFMEAVREAYSFVEKAQAATPPPVVAPPPVAPPSSLPSQDEIEVTEEELSKEIGLPPKK